MLAVNMMVVVLLVGMQGMLVGMRMATSDMQGMLEDMQGPWVDTWMLQMDMRVDTRMLQVGKRAQVELAEVVEKDLQTYHKTWLVA